MFMKDFIHSPAAATVTAADRRARPVSSGILAGTLVETATGWRAVETLRIGDLVQSFDGGLVKVLSVHRRILRAELAQAIVAVPGGALDTCADLSLLPGQHLLIDTLADPDLPDDAFVLIPAVALEGHRGCTRRHALREIAVATPLFATEEILWANSGLLIHCPGIAEGPDTPPDSDFFARLDVTAARALLTRRERRLMA